MEQLGKDFHAAHAAIRHERVRLKKELAEFLKTCEMEEASRRDGHGVAMNLHNHGFTRVC